MVVQVGKTKGGTKMTTENKNAITWVTFNNIVPIVVSTISIVVSFMSLSGKVDLLTQRVDILIENQKTIVSKYEGVQTRLGKLELDTQKFYSDLYNHMEK